MNNRQARQVLEDSNLANSEVGVRFDALRAALHVVSSVGRHGSEHARPALNHLEAADGRKKVGDYPDLMSAIKSAAAVFKEAEWSASDLRALKK